MRYNNNEIYFDVTEELKAIVSPYVHPNLLLAAAGIEARLAGQNGNPLQRGLWEDRLYFQVIG